MAGNRRASWTDKYRTTKGKYHCLKRSQVNTKMYQRLSSLGLTLQIRVFWVSKNSFT